MNDRLKQSCFFEKKKKQKRELEKDKKAKNCTGMSQSK